MFIVAAYIKADPPQKKQRYIGFVPSLNIHVEDSSPESTLSKLKIEIHQKIETILKEDKNFDLRSLSTAHPMSSEEDYTEHLIHIDPLSFNQPTVRFNVSWPIFISKAVDKHVKNHHLTRSGFLANAALEKITPYTNLPEIDNPFINNFPIKYTLHRMDYFLNEISKSNESYEKNEGVIQNQEFCTRLMVNHLMFEKYCYAAQKFVNNESYEEYIKILNKYHRPSGNTICGTSILRKIPFYVSIIEGLEIASKY